LIQALGGGWNVTQIPSVMQVTSKDAALQAAKIGEVKE